MQRLFFFFLLYCKQIWKIASIIVQIILYILWFKCNEDAAPGVVAYYVCMWVTTYELWLTAAPVQVCSECVLLQYSPGIHSTAEKHTENWLSFPHASN